MEVLDKILGCSLGKGAGISGPAIARRLSAHAVSGALVERAADVSFGVSKANSGIIRAAFHHNWKVAAARRTADGWQLESAHDERIEAWWVVNAEGLHTDEVSEIFGAGRYTISPRKGEEFLLERGCAALPSRVIFSKRHKSMTFLGLPSGLSSDETKTLVSMTTFTRMLWPCGWHPQRPAPCTPSS